MPPESPVNEDELSELLEQFKEANGTLYQELISITGANSETLKNFISQIAKNENLNAEAIKKILTANSDSDQDLQNYLDNFLNGFEKVTNSSQDQVNNIISGFSSQSAMFQKNLEKIQAKTLAKTMSKDPGLKDAFERYARESLRFQKHIEKDYGATDPDELAKNLERSRKKYSEE